MINILDYIEEHPKETQRLIGLEYPQLQQLIQNAEKVHEQKQALLEEKKIRIIGKGGGRKQKLSIQEQIILNEGLFETYDHFPTSWHPVWSK